MGEVSVAEIAESLPLFADYLVENAPRWFVGIMKGKKLPREQELVLLGSLAISSSLITHVHGVYHNRTVLPI